MDMPVADLHFVARDLRHPTNMNLIQAARRSHRAGMDPADEGVDSQQEAGSDLPRKWYVCLHLPATQWG